MFVVLRFFTDSPACESKIKIPVTAYTVMLTELNENTTINSSAMW